MSAPNPYSDIPPGEIWVSQNIHEGPTKGDQLVGDPCPGLFTYQSSDLESRCSACGAFTGVAAPGHLWVVKTKALDPPELGTSPRDTYNRTKLATELVVPGYTEATVVLKALVHCFKTGDTSQVPNLVSTLYFDHQSEDVPTPHGPTLFTEVVAHARTGMPKLDITIEYLTPVGPGRAEALLTWEFVDALGQPQKRHTLESILVQDGQAVEHWGMEVSLPE